MGSITLTLTYYGLLRLARRRQLLAVLLALPVVAALAWWACPGVRTWMCLILCAAVASGVIWVRHSLDRASGLAAAVACSPVAASQVLWSRVLTAACVFAAQSAILGAVSAVWR